MSQGTKAERRKSREGRLGAALRENLKRRKAQVRGRSPAGGGPAGPEAGGAESAGGTAGIRDAGERRAAGPELSENVGSRGES
jgi:hypothetical protein